MKRPLSSDRGSTLLLSLWALVLLSSCILVWARNIDREIQVSQETNAGLSATAMAHSGAAVALHPGVSQRTAALQAAFGRQGYRATILGEGGRLNLNWLLNGQDLRRVNFLKQYLTARGLSLEQTQNLVDSMLDWVGPAGLTHLNAAQETGDYHPPHRPFASIDEVRLVHGAGPLVKQEGWEDDFTLYSQGPVDLLAAPLSVLRAIPGVGPDRARSFLQQRQGPDGVDGTADDHLFASMQEIEAALGITQTQFAAMDGLVGLSDPTVRIRSVGWDGKVQRELEIVARKSSAANGVLTMPNTLPVNGSFTNNGAGPQIFLWHEL